MPRPVGLRLLRSRLRALWNGKRRQSELDEELRFHLDTEAEERQEAGVSGDDAKRSIVRDGSEHGVLVNQRSVILARIKTVRRS